MKALSVDRLFLIKTIGDEFWFVYEVDIADVEDLRSTASTLMDVVLGTLRRGLSIALPSRPVADSTTGASEADINWIKFAPPLKGTMDLLTNVVELNFAHYDHLPSDLGGSKREDWQNVNSATDARSSSTIASISAAPQGEASRHAASTAVRTDYVGIDVDVFFRITRFCRPGLLLVGDNLRRRWLRIADIQGFEHWTSRRCVSLFLWNRH